MFHLFSDFFYLVKKEEARLGLKYCDKNFDNKLK
jgi:hypothetical protein